MAKITNVCERCGSNDVVVDAWVSWAEGEQKWVLDEIHFDLDESYYCRGCEQITGIRDKEI